MNRERTQREFLHQSQFLDLNTGWNNYHCYEKDFIDSGFNKLCMVKLENSELLTTHLGHKTYISMMKDAMDQIKAYLNNLPQALDLHAYTFSANMFFVAASEKLDGESFVEEMHSLFEKFCFVNLDGLDGVLITRFAVVLEQKHMIEQALKAFSAEQNTQIPFLICECEETLPFPLDEEFKMIGVLSRAIVGDGIIPYFQGIYDNKVKKITRYEALMRIKDHDGTLYIPAQFMSIAKKYHLYSYLSKRMMEKVCLLFENRMRHVGLNFSIFDFTSIELQQVIRDILKKMKYAPNFILEILEDEKLCDMEILQSFISEVRRYGVKVAIDDFGSGYSSLLEIASIKPDYIKIDGEIIRNVHKETDNRKILDAIVYMGELFGAEIIAEHVENQEIQKEIAQRNIRFSQGYYFSVPKPFSQIRGEIQRME